MKYSKLIVVGVLLVLSLLAAVVLFHFFESYAEVKNKNLSLGGAAAGFVIIFYLLRTTYFKLATSEEKIAHKSYEEKIEYLQNSLKDALASHLDNFHTPDGYTPELSTEFRFGFCYPSSWTFSKFPKQTMYGIALDLESDEHLNFARNINIVIGEIDDDLDNIEDIFRVGKLNFLAIMPNPEIIEDDNYLFRGLPATKHVIKYERNDGIKLVLYQIGVVVAERRNLYWISFTTTQDDFLESRMLFENILSTFRI